MCLSYELTKPRADKIKAEARKRGYIRVYKVCGTNSFNCTGVFRQTKYKERVCEAYGNNTDKNVGWYAFLSQRMAKGYLIKSNKEEIKVCYAKPSWIKRLGRDDRSRHIGIFTHLAFPDWDKGDMTIREFRDMCKGKP